MVDASAAVSALTGDGPARAILGEHRLHAPHVVDVEVAQALRRRVAAGDVAAGDGANALATWARLGVTRHPVTGLLGRIWELRDNLSAYDAAYAALAEALEIPLVTADGRLGRAPGVRCAVTVVPR